MLLRLRWRLSAKLLELANRLIRVEMHELAVAMANDPKHAAALLENLEFRLDARLAQHPELIRFATLLDFELRDLVDDDMYDTLAKA